MKIMFQPAYMPTIRFQNRNCSYVQNLNNNHYDTFVKSSSNVSFGNADTNEEKPKRDIIADLAIAGAVGAPLLLSIAANFYAMKGLDSKDIFLPDGTYFMNTDDFQVETDVVTADGDDGIFKIKNTPIDIDASKYDLADPDNGIYKNYDGSVDIDLLNNKYIDFNKGIFLDPENNISFLKLDDGTVKQMVLPDMLSPSFSGSSIGTSSYIPHRLTREEYININGSTPEENLAHIYPDEGAVPALPADRIVDPDDNRTFAQKLMDFFNPFSPDNGINHMYDKSKEYDIFGREILEYVTPNGDVIKFPLDETLKTVLDKYDLDVSSVFELSEFFDKLKLKDYLSVVEPSPDYSNFLEIPSLHDFLTNLCENHPDITSVVSEEAVNTLVSGTAEHHGTFLNFIQEAFQNILSQ